jgi:hypothetical protein
MFSTARLAAGALAVLLPAACAGKASSGLHGQARKGPTSPVCRAGSPCDAPVQTTLVFSRGGRTVATVRTSTSGRYRIAVAPGTYDVRSRERIGIGRLPRPGTVHVRRGHRDRIDFLFDTGIR